MKILIKKIICAILFIAPNILAMDPNIIQQQNTSQFTCMWDQCRLSFDNQNDYYIHVNNHSINNHRRGITSCKWTGCNYITAEPYCLKDHIKTHTGEKPHKCTYDGCDYAAVQLGNLTRHIRTHTGEKPYKCTYDGCNYAATRSSGLKDHIKTHTGEKPHKCTYDNCDYAAAGLSSLKKHIRTHTKEAARILMDLDPENDLEKEYHRTKRRKLSE